MNGRHFTRLDRWLKEFPGYGVVVSALRPAALNFSGAAQARSTAPREVAGDGQTLRTWKRKTGLPTFFRGQDSLDSPSPLTPYDVRESRL